MLQGGWGAATVDYQLAAIIELFTDNGVIRSGLNRLGR